MPSADIISAVEFDHDGLHLATGDRGGRVVLFERVNPNAVSRGASDELCVSHPGFAAGYIHRTSSLFIALHAFDIMLIVLLCSLAPAACGGHGSASAPSFSTRGRF